ncbi:MAG: FHA domain-containing protein [Planctomycetota bacterium]|nr:MAG: FHA domain-containing protein [Planctomycetota bacterium]
MEVILQVIAGSRTGERIPITEFPAILGRNEACDVAFAAEEDAGVSQRHASIVIEGGAPVIRDMNSTNGTYADKQKVSRFILSDGVIIRLAIEGPEFRIILDDEALEASEAAIKREKGGD